MKLSKLDQDIVNSAKHIYVDYYYDCLSRREGYIIRCVNTCSNLILGCPAKMWKTEFGAFRAASKLRPDLADIDIFYALGGRF